MSSSIKEIIAMYIYVSLQLLNCLWTPVCLCVCQFYLLSISCSLVCASPRSRPDLRSVGGILPIVPLPSEAESRANERPPSKPWCNITHESEGAKKANKASPCKSIGRTAGCSVRERHGALQRVSFSAVFHAGTLG